MTANRQMIVIAWAEKTGMRATGRTVTRDMNRFPEFVPAWEGKACVWLNRGTAADLEKANNYAAANKGTVFTFPTSEADPLGKAREIVRVAAIARDDDPDSR